MLLVDGERSDWRRWVTAARVSPATRRIPIVVVGDTPRRDEALDAGADGVLSPDGLADQLADLIATRARRLNPAQAEALERQCREPLPPLARQGIEAFNAGEYYRQHDLFEALWMQETGPVRDLYRAILQVGVAYYQIRRGNRRGAIKMLLRSRQWLTRLPEACQGVDVRQLREDAARVRAALEDLNDISAFDQSLLRPVRLVEPPADPLK